MHADLKYPRVCLSSFQLRSLLDLHIISEAEISPADTFITMVIKKASDKHISKYRRNISRTLVGNKLADHSDGIGASPVGAAPTPSSFSI